MKPIKFSSNWGSTEIEPCTRELPGKEMRIFITVRGPKGGNPRSDYLSPVQALGLAAYLQAWALEVLK
jgi:hypothetical protein